MDARVDVPRKPWLSGARSRRPIFRESSAVTSMTSASHQALTTRETTRPSSTTRRCSSTTQAWPLVRQTPMRGSDHEHRVRLSSAIS